MSAPTTMHPAGHPALMTRAVPGHTAQNAERTRCLIFRVANEHFAIRLEDIQEVTEEFSVTPLPVAPPFVLGLTSFRGRLAAVVDLQKRFGLNGESAGRPRLLVLKHRRFPTALKVNETGDVVWIAADAVRRPEQVDPNRPVAGVAIHEGRILSLIDSEKLEHEFILTAAKETDMETAAARSATSFLNTGSLADVAQLVTFTLRDDTFAVRIEEVQEINTLLTVTRVPRSPRFVEGVVNLRGSIVPVVNLRERFGIERIPYDTHTKIVIIQAEDKRVGLIVDSVSQVLRVARNAIQAAPADAVGGDAPFIHGVVDLDGRLIIVLDLKQILSAKEVHDLAGMTRLAGDGVDALSQDNHNSIGENLSPTGAHNNGSNGKTIS